MIGSPRRRSLGLLLACGLALGLGQDASFSTSVGQGAAGFGHAFLKSFAVIMATEIGARALKRCPAVPCLRHACAAIYLSPVKCGRLYWAGGALPAVPVHQETRAGCVCTS
jgi:hypothetical protein